MEEWEEEEGGEGGKEGGLFDTIQEGLENVDKRVLAVGLLVGSALLVGFLYYCCWVRRRRRARLVELELEREKARWV